MKYSHNLFPDGIRLDANDNVLTPSVSVFNRLARTKKDLSMTEKSSMVRSYRIYLNFLDRS